MLTIALAVLSPGLLICLWLLSRRSASKLQEPIPIGALRKKLPRDLTQWRTNQRYITSWNYLRTFLAEHGYRLWSFNPIKPHVLLPPNWEGGAPNGFLYALFVPPDTAATTGTISSRLEQSRPILWPARHEHGDVVIRVLSVGKEGQQSLKIVRRLATAPEALIRSNHALPLFREVVLEDIVLGVFPRVTTDLAETLSPDLLPWIAEEDILDIFAQCLEALEFLHENLIAHLNVTLENFLVDYPPLSRTPRRPVTGRCRVYITDFDWAVGFSPSTPLSERICYGERYMEEGCMIPKAPEMHAQSFSPFPVDCWQLASSILKTDAIPHDNKSATELLRTLADDDPTCRPLARDALESILAIARSSVREDTWAKLPYDPL